MKFQFNVRLTERDYLNYNVFWNFRSPYGYKPQRAGRIAVCFLALVACLFTLWQGNFTMDAVYKLSPVGVVFLLALLLVKPIAVRSLKSNIKGLKQKGKLPYSPCATIEFGEHHFTEITPDRKTEWIYSTIERISIINAKFVYIHLNTLSACILPLAYFESQKQYQEFISFMQTKCENIDVYQS